MLRGARRWTSVLAIVELRHGCRWPKLDPGVSASQGGLDGRPPMHRYFRPGNAGEGEGDRDSDAALRSEGRRFEAGLDSDLEGPALALGARLAEKVLQHLELSCRLRGHEGAILTCRSRADHRLTKILVLA